MPSKRTLVSRSYTGQVRFCTERVMQCSSLEVSLSRATSKSRGMLNLKKMGADGDNWIPLNQ